MKQNDQYAVKIDGSGRVTLRNRRFLWVYKPLRPSRQRQMLARTPEPLQPAAVIPPTFRADPQTQMDVTESGHRGGPYPDELPTPTSCRQENTGSPPPPLPNNESPTPATTPSNHTCPKSTPPVPIARRSSRSTLGKPPDRFGVQTY